MSAHRILQDLYYSPLSVADPGNGKAINIRKNGASCNLVTTGVETRTLAQPTKAGIRCRITLSTDGGDCTLTVTGGYNSRSDTTMLFNTAGDTYEFESIKVGSSFYWRITPAEAAVKLATTHGAGVIGTAVAPVAVRRIEGGDVITEYKVDLTGLSSKNTANDVIGLAAGGVAKLDQYTVAAHGLIYKMELVCLEAPAGGDNDVNVVLASSGTIAYDGAGGTAYGVDGGDGVAGQVVADLVQGITADHYFYLTAGTGDTADVYTAGMYIVRTYGHALLS